MEEEEESAMLPRAVSAFNSFVLAISSSSSFIFPSTIKEQRDDRLLPTDT
jgi:hypothetical protein